MRLVFNVFITDFVGEGVLQGRAFERRHLLHPLVPKIAYRL